MSWECVELKFDISQIDQIQAFSFWIEGICQFTVGIVGIISNLLSIPILSSAGMKSIFNKLLICLLVFHTVYIVCVLLTETFMWKASNDNTNSQSISVSWFIISYSFVLHPLQQLMRISATFFTILMARQRYLAIRHPVEYRNANLTVNPWIPVTKTLMLVLAMASLITFPLYFETSVKRSEIRRLQDVNDTHSKYVSTLSTFRVTICSVHIKTYSKQILWTFISLIFYQINR